MYFYDVLVCRPFDKEFTYSSEVELKPGTGVCVNFGRTTTFGVVIKQNSCLKSKGGKSKDCDASYKIKPILSILPVELKSSELKFLNSVSAYNLAPRGMILKQMMPKNAIQIPKPDGKKSRAARVEELEYEAYNFNLHTLNDEQNDVYKSIGSDLNTFQAHLIDGETGSGKTEIYLQLAYDIIMQHKGQVLILLPEIFLTKQLITRFTERIGCKPTEWHSNLTPKRRRENFHKILTGKSKFIIGARSALFLPYHNLKLIVVDEEHDRSYKQEEGCIYNARDMAVLRGQLLDINVVLTSATPALESFHNVKTDRYQHHKLHNRFGAGALPQVKIIDLNKFKLESGRLISQQLLIDIRRILHDGKQVLLFLNKRGYAPVVHCNNCNYRESCDHCNSLLVYHKRGNKLMCHHCGFTKHFESNCSKCGSEDLNMFGLGIERLASEVNKLFPDHNALTLNSDVMSNSKSIEDAITQITNGEAQIIIGTQIISKGLHFPNLRMVAIVDAESNVMGYDPRALEHTYQLLHQVSGRAGREDDKGLVVLQTYEPDNPVFQCMQTFDKNSFYNFEYSARKITKTAPFSRMFSVTVVDSDEVKCVEALDECKRLLPKDYDGLEILGPAPTPMYYLRGQYRYRMVIKAPKNLNLQKNLKEVRDYVCNSFKTRIIVDVDPYNFL